MIDSVRFAFHRPEIAEMLRRGDEKIELLMLNKVRTYSAGTVLVEADTEHNRVYRMRKGWAARMRQLEDGRRQAVLDFLPGDLFAVKSMFVSMHPDSIEALSDIEVDEIDCMPLLRAYGEDRDIAVRCTWQVVEEERRLHNWVVSLGRGSAEERLAMLFLDYKGRLVRAGAIPPDALEYAFPLRQEHLSEHIGLSIVHVNRVLKGLREQGIVTVRGQKVKIHNLDALARLATPLLDSYESNAPEYVGRDARPATATSA